VRSFNPAEFARFLQQASASNVEVDLRLQFAEDVEAIPADVHAELAVVNQAVPRMMASLRRMCRTS
jgi:hypothetical protein